MHLLRHQSAALVLIASLIATPVPARAAESYDNCTGFITSVPTTITTQGTWCMNQDLSTAMTSGAAITIATNNVTIDCNDFKLGGLAAGLATQTIGISAASRFNVTVRHCNIRGFLYGLNFQGSESGGHVIEDNRFDGNTFAGLSVVGDGSVVRRNLVRDTGGSAILTGEAVGINTVLAVDVHDNTVSDVLPSANASGGDALGIVTSLNTNGSIRDNRVRGLVALGTGATHGIDSNGTRVSLDRNHVIGDGSAGSIGLRCSDNSARAINNIVNGFTVPISLCRSEGNSL